MAATVLVVETKPRIQYELGILVLLRYTSEFCARRISRARVSVAGLVPAGMQDRELQVMTSWGMGVMGHRVCALT